MTTNYPHPDQHLITTVTKAINRWAAERTTPFPTSQFTGGGAFDTAERRLSAMFDHRHVQLAASATYAMRAALQAVGVTEGSEVLTPAIDWSSTATAIRSLGATVVPVAVDPCTMTIDPEGIRSLLTPRTAAVVICHLHGIAADAVAVSAEVPGLPMIEDLAAAFGSTLDAAPVGTFGDIAVASFATGKTIDAGEGAALIIRDELTAERLLTATAHPLRQQLAGFREPEMDALSIRPHPLLPILLMEALDGFDLDARVDEHAQFAQELGQLPGVRVLGGYDERRQSPSRAVAVVGQLPAHLHHLVSPSTALSIASTKSSRTAQPYAWLITRR
ncbi:aminotransferase class I/II-fold pyridoxal phosphate-dependent enzyme [Rathayibacter sp. AY1C5]|uniref:aminotransferase class I/II-fold pyridoxal phosphate-dependent enzyme n=2 Tax=unclassified Rathayibacter TaxID=2609250 RepID=UPI0015E2A603|nr:aminotransferase class I/II-fold pyridoxal phosphate-dependent enzyme [Rathayibacter sp. AY1C5]